MGKLLTRDQILQAQDIQTEKVDVPEWGGSVLVRGLDGKSRDQFEAEAVIRNGDEVQVNYENLRAKLIAKTVVDEEGNLIFSSADVEALGKKSGRALQRVFNVAQKLSGMTREDFKELVKNSEKIPGATSPSRSRANSK